MRLLIGFFALLAFWLGAIPAWADGAQSSTATFDIPVSGTVTNPCNGEALVWQGTAHFVAHQTLTSDGRNTIVDVVTFQGVQGDGASGTIYRVINTATFESNSSAGSAQNEFTATGAFLWVSEGTAPNFESHVTVHMTLDAAGQPTADVAIVDASCRG
jgi:hypothetical protein